jgi:hypothetical protein
MDQTENVANYKLARLGVLRPHRGHSNRRKRRH